MVVSKPKSHNMLLFFAWQLSLSIITFMMISNLSLIDAYNYADHKPKSLVIDIAKWGKVQGYQDELDGKNISVYLGIPYAQPPVGKLRFNGEYDQYVQNKLYF